MFFYLFHKCHHICVYGMSARKSYAYVCEIKFNKRGKKYKIVR